MTEFNHFVGLDVHKDTIIVAEAPLNGKAQVVGVVPHGEAPVAEIRRALESKGVCLDKAAFCYEAGPTGYGLQRAFAADGFRCDVVAPSLTPVRPGDRVKTDRRDARKLAQFLRAGELRGIHVPDEPTEAMRDLERCREDAKNAQRVARQSLQSFLLRHGRRYSGVTPWTKAHFAWIRAQNFAYEAQRRVLADYLRTVETTTTRVADLEKDIAELVASWELAPLVKGLQALRGVSLVTAVVIAAEVGDLSRFRTAPEFMGYLGLVPSEHSSGGRCHRSRITKTGNGHVRRVLVEAAWAYRFPARVSGPILRRQKGVAKEVCAIAWKAQKRLCARYHRHLARGKNKQQTVTAVARELAGFIWAIGQQAQLLAN